MPEAYILRIIRNAKIRIQRSDEDSAAFSSYPSKQCPRFSSPRLHTPCDFEKFLKSAEFSCFPRYFFYEKSQNPWQPEAGIGAGKFVLCVVPEEGWEDREVSEKHSLGEPVNKVMTLIPSPWGRI